jgi:GWxTD domain-containing protein
MQRFIIVSALVYTLLPFWGFAQRSRPQAMLSYHRFQSLGKTPYLETTLTVKGNSVKYAANEAGNYQASIEVFIAVYKNDRIHFADRFNLLSPETEDSIGTKFNFLHQLRIPITNGEYALELSINDNHRTIEKVSARDTLSINFAPDSVNFSDIQFIERAEKSDKNDMFHKGGYLLMPYLADYYPAETEKLTFYTEVYKSLDILGEGKKYVVQYFIEEAESGKKLENFGGFKKMGSAAMNAVLSELDISELSTGQYRLVVEARDAENALLARKSSSFARYNPFTNIEPDKIVSIITDGSFAEQYANADSLAEHMRCISPIASPRENSFAERLIEEKNLQNMKQFFLAFWKNRNPDNPAKAWEKYYLEVRKVQLAFGTSIRKGYMTDRGRVYLQYGPPDNRTQSLREPSAYPYEIWQYYKINNQSNRRFVFYNPDLVTNDFALIHSDALGEIINDQWMFLVMKRDTQTNDIDAMDADPHYGSQLRQNFMTPR